MQKHRSNITICFWGTRDHKKKLTKWADEDERSVSYIIRKLITNESKRREEVQAQKVVQN